MHNLDIFSLLNLKKMCMIKNNDLLTAIEYVNSITSYVDSVK